MEAKETAARVRASGLRVRDTFTRRWPPRVAQMVLGGLLFLSAFLWPHDPAGFGLALVGGLVLLGLAAASAFVSPVRLVLGLACAWFAIATVVTTNNGPTIVVHLFVAGLILLLCALPPNSISLFRYRELHRQGRV